MTLRWDGPAAAAAAALPPSEHRPPALSLVADARPAGLWVLVIDPDSASRAELAAGLAANPVVGRVRTAGDAGSALRALREEAVDVVFVEVDLPGVDGVDLAWLLRRLADAPEIVFISQRGDQAMAAFELGAIDYVLKPFPPERVIQSLGRVPASRVARSQAASTDGQENDERTIGVEVNGRRRMLSCTSVRWIRAHGDYAQLHTSDGHHLVGVSLARLAERWASAGFQRIHRSYIVQLDLVTEVSLTASGGVAIVDGRRLPVSRRYVSELRARLAS